ncbi:MAG: hypothetical protein K2Z81_26925, partial [Cyanobacteria bacterium]|nr:hypothetical protein [Cyanobacteriota bacterium]
MFPQGLMSQAYFLCMVCGGGILIFNFVMGHMDGNDSGGDHGGHFHSDHGGDLHHGGHHHDGDHGGDQHDTTHKYAVLPMEESLTNRIAKFLLGMLSPMSMC